MGWSIYHSCLGAAARSAAARHLQRILHRIRRLRAAPDPHQQPHDPPNLQQEGGLANQQQALRTVQYSTEGIGRSTNSRDCSVVCSRSICGLYHVLQEAVALDRHPQQPRPDRTNTSTSTNTNTSGGDFLRF